MSQVQLFLLEYDKSRQEASAIAQQSASQLESKQLKLVDLIESLGEYLNNDDVSIRNKAMAYLAEVLAATPLKLLSRQQRNLLCDFLLSRLADDREGAGHCARGLLALEQRGRWEPERAAEVMNAMLNGTHPLRQFKLQGERFAILTLMDVLMAKYRDAIRELHEEDSTFMQRFISYFDGEKDPRNLMIVFSILKVPMSEWDLRTDAQYPANDHKLTRLQDLFDAVFNYFPITFRPPPDDPYGITAQQLKDRLRECIGSTGEFAPYSFPALLDKLDSTSLNTKRDVLAALQTCITEYGSSVINLYAITLWDALKFEILNAQEEDLSEEALGALALIAQQLSRGTPAQLQAYLKPICKECNEHFEDAPTKQSQAAGRIVQAVASVSPAALNTIVASTLPQILQLFQSSNDMAKRRGLFEILTQLLKADNTVYGEWRAKAGELDTSEEVDEAPPAGNILATHADQVFDLFINALLTANISQVSYRLLALRGLLELAKIRVLLAEQEIIRVIKSLCDIIITEESHGRDEVRTAAINGVVEMAHQKPQLVIDHAFPAFMAYLPDKDTEDSPTYIPVLEAFAKLSTEAKISDTVVVRLKNKLQAALHQQSSTRYIRAILSAQLWSFVNGSLDFSGTANHSPYHDTLLLPLLSMIAGPDTGMKIRDELCLDLVGRICNRVFRVQSLQFQTALADEIYSLYGDKDTPHVRPEALDASKEGGRRLIVSSYFLASLQREVLLPFDIHDTLTKLLRLAPSPELSPMVRAAVMRQLSLLINKFVLKADIKTIVEPLLSPTSDLLARSTLDESKIRTAFALLKGLVLRNVPAVRAALIPLLDLLGDPRHGAAVARGFATLLQPDDMLTVENHCVISGLHKQKVFATVVPQIESSVRTADADSKTNYLVALAGILRWLPYQIISPELRSLMPLLLQILDVKVEGEIKGAAVTVLASILKEEPTVVEEYISSVVTRLLNTGSSKENPPTVRSSALNCLGMIPVAIKKEVVLPFRRQVFKRLSTALDDGKRSVRTEAVRCRTKWSDLDSAGDDDE